MRSACHRASPIDLGIVHSNYSRYSSRGPARSYTEAYAGVGGKLLSSRISVSRGYLKPDAWSLYGELDANVPAGTRLRLTGHVGVLVPLDRHGYRRGPTEPSSTGGLGIARDLGPDNGQRRFDRQKTRPRSLSRTILWAPRADLRGHIRPVERLRESEPMNRPRRSRHTTGAFKFLLSGLYPTNRRAFIEADEGAFLMKATILLLGAATLALAPAFASAQTAPGNGQNNGKGYWHTNGPATTGQPGADCEEIIANGGSSPGQAADNGHSAFLGSAGDRLRRLTAAEFPQHCVRFAIRRGLRQSARLI